MPEPRSWRWGAPRLITRAQARAYLQVTEGEFAARLEAGHVPGPLWGCSADLSAARWDRLAIDRALDRASAIPSHLKAAEEELDHAFAPGRRTPPARQAG